MAKHYNYCSLFLLNMILISVIAEKINRNAEKDNMVEQSETQQQLATLKTFNLTTWNLVTKNDIKIFKILQESLTLTNLNSSKSFPKIDTINLWDFSDKLCAKYEYDEEIFNIEHPPLLRLNQNNKNTNNFNKNMLVLIYLGARYPSENLSELKKFLAEASIANNLHKIIFIKDTFITNTHYTDFAVELLNWLHNHGFWQSLLMDFAGNTLSLQHITGSFVKNLTLEEFLLQSNKWPNLHNFPINYGVANNPPRAYIQQSDKQRPKIIALKGYYGTIIRIFAQHYNASLNPFLLNNNLSYSSEWNCVNLILGSKVDICVDILPINKQYVVSTPLELRASYLIVPFNKPLPRFFYFLKPFQPNVWILVTSSFLYKVLTLSLIHRLQHGSWNGGLQITYAVLSVLYLPFELTHIKGRLRRILEFLMILVGFVVANWYLSILSSLLFTRLYFHDIKTLQHLVQHNISIMVDDFDQYVLNTSHTNTFIMQQLKVVSNDVVMQHLRNLDARFVYCSQYDKINFYLHQQKFLLRPRMKILTGITPINEILAGMPMRPNWPAQHLLNDFIRRLFESGVTQHIYANTLREGIASGYLHYFTTEHHHVEPLTIEYFQLPGMLLAGGYSLAFICFLLELLVFKKIS